MWDNQVQEYLPVGTLFLDREKRLGFVGFIYDRDYVKNGLPAIDPAHLDPQKRDGRYVCRFENGRLPHYFSSFLPGEFSQHLLVDVDSLWTRLSEAEKLYVMTLAHGDFGAPQLNPQNKQYNDAIQDMSTLNKLITAIRHFQQGDAPNPITEELYGALCSFHGTKPKIDYREIKGDVSRRFVVKLNTTDHFNDARVSAVMQKIEDAAGIETCDTRLVKLDNGEDVLFSYNYAHSDMYKKFDDGDSEHIIMKYNRVSFRVLLAEDPILDNTQRPSYCHIVHAIEKYSSDPETDKQELYRRAVFSASVNHTANGLDNMEMYDTGGGKWRLSPSFNNLPNPISSTEYDVSFTDTASTHQLLDMNELFLEQLGKEFGFNAIRSKSLALPVLTAVSNIQNVMTYYDLSENDSKSVAKCIKIDEVNKLKSNIEQDPDINLMNDSLHSIELNENVNEEKIELTKPVRGPGMS